MLGELRINLIQNIRGCINALYLDKMFCKAMYTSSAKQRAMQSPTPCKIEWYNNLQRVYHFKYQGHSIVADLEDIDDNWRKVSRIIAQIVCDCLQV